MNTEIQHMEEGSVSVGNSSNVMLGMGGTSIYRTQLPKEETASGFSEK